MGAEIPFFDEGVNPAFATKERDTVYAIVYDPIRDAVLCLDWKNYGWRTFVIGGVDSNEDVASAAYREVCEETGYVRARYQCTVGKVRSRYFANHKCINHVANATGVLFVLDDSTQAPTLESETRHHSYVWIARTEVAAFVNLRSQSYIWNCALAHIRAP